VPVMAFFLLGWGVKDIIYFIDFFSFVKCYWFTYFQYYFIFHLKEKCSKEGV